MNRQERKDELIKQAVALMADERVAFVPATPTDFDKFQKKLCLHGTYGKYGRQPFNSATLLMHNAIALCIHDRRPVCWINMGRLSKIPCGRRIF